MGKNTSILLGDYFEKYVNEQLRTGKFATVSEVIRAALRLMESEENKSKILVKELKAGERSKKVDNFDRAENLKKLHAANLAR
ncbi:MAG TPA: type II toxin-antitoxin system ParD family antitoxin [Bacteroidales bacterium]|nr:type II toxin-antitoxin system ParD family antitoxin [Bacteroidales bacterium]